MASSAPREPHPSDVTGEEWAFVDQGDTRATPAPAQGISRDVITLPDATRGCGLLPGHWVIERSVTLASRFRRSVGDDERLPAGMSVPLRTSCRSDRPPWRPNVHTGLQLGEMAGSQHTSEQCHEPARGRDRR